MRQPDPSNQPYTNPLIHEKSPYLLQHAHNPVAWHPWGEEAFSLARKQDKLIFLSIGYSTCHWCHVMAHECFEDESVAQALEKNYVAVKVDREERPDIDQIYMEFCQRLTGRGGWPLTLVLTTDGLPVFAATYLPKDPRPGYDGFIALLDRIAMQAREKAPELRQAGEQLLAVMQPAPTRDSSSTSLTPLYASAISELRRSYDSDEGGFGNAPKFPTPHHLRFLIRRWHIDKRQELLQMSEQSLEAMRRGGIFDHLGGGFHRYSTDRQWLLPHFEKMLYDQAGLAEAYLDAWLATDNPSYAETTRAILDYVCRDLHDPCGAFHAAEDADSEGEEGLYYVWSQEEVERILDPERARVFNASYNIKPEGNYRDEVSHRETGLNILYLTASFEALSERFDLSPAEFQENLSHARAQLCSTRQKRPRPHRDDKILCAWNGMIVGALARAGRYLGRDDYVLAATQATDFILNRMRREDGRLLRRWRDGEAAIPAFAEDYAFLVRGLLELYQADFKTERLLAALELAEDLYRLFTTEGGSLFDTGSDSETLVARPQTVYDGAYESANTVAIDIFVRLYLVTGEHLWRERAEAIVQDLGSRVKDMPSAFTGMLHATTALYEESYELVIVGDREQPDTRALLKVATASRKPNLSLLLKRPGSQELDQIAPFTTGMALLNGSATAYLCRGQSCQQPTTDPEEMRRQLGS